MACQTQYTHINQSPPPPSFSPGSFSLCALSKSDIHASPLPQPRYILTAPTTFYPAFPRALFVSARVSFAYTPTLQYDHAGLVLILPEGASSSSVSSDSPYPSSQNVTKQTSWVKAGLEAKDGEVFLSVVTKTAGGWCDWSLHPIPPGRLLGLGNKVEATIEFVRSKNALHVNCVRRSQAEGEEKEQTTMLRKIPWVFLDEHDGVVDRDDTRWAVLGAFAARPDPDGAALHQGLEVRFDGFAVQTA